jgi:N-acetylhexosamine 1-kinase
LVRSLNLPERATHNDPKIGNVLFDQNNGEAIALIDWDTIQAGSLLSDFGDMARTMTPTFSEDHQRSEEVVVNPELFAAMAEGFLQPLRGLMSPAEAENLLQGAYWIVLEQAMRFLDDYLGGDVYYKIRYPAHNIDRARNQLALYRSLREREERLQKMLR